MGTAIDEVPVAHTPPGGWETMPGPVLADCDEAIVAGAPDLRGLWEVVEVVDTEGVRQHEHPMQGLRQRIEQAGDRVVVMCKSVTHDMRCDGSTERGVNDVFEFDRATPLVVRATYEDGVHVLRPEGLEGIEVRRWIEGGQLIWTYGGLKTTSKRIGDS